MDPTMFIGIIASTCTGISLLPQLIKMYKEKKANEVSFLMLLILFIGLALWSWYGYMKKDWIIIISNSFSFCINLAILILSIRYRKN